jgi:hypothetical protein
MTNPADIQAVQAKQLKNGKFEFTAILVDGSEEIIKKAGIWKPIVNVYSGNANMNNWGLGNHCTYNTKAGVKNFWDNNALPIKSIEVELVA